MKDGFNLSLAVTNVDISNDTLLELYNFGVLAGGLPFSARAVSQLTPDPARSIHSELSLRFCGWQFFAPPSVERVGWG
jgi:hypothetical protein